jgi:hypothetical protein
LTSSSVSLWETNGSTSDQHLAGLRVRQVHLLDHQRLAELLQHRRAHLHPGFLHVVRDLAAAKAMAASRP